LLSFHLRHPISLRRSDAGDFLLTPLIGGFDDENETSWGANDFGSKLAHVNINRAAKAIGWHS
jgi:hypothetical protein